MADAGGGGDGPPPGGGEAANDNVSVGEAANDNRPPQAVGGEGPDGFVDAKPHAPGEVDVNESKVGEGTGATNDNVSAGEASNDNVGAREAANDNTPRNAAGIDGPDEQPHSGMDAANDNVDPGHTKMADATTAETDKVGAPEDDDRNAGTTSDDVPEAIRLEAIDQCARAFDTQADSDKYGSADAWEPGEKRKGELLCQYSHLENPPAPEARSSFYADLETLRRSQGDSALIAQDIQTAPYSASNASTLEQQVDAALLAQNLQSAPHKDLTGELDNREWVHIYEVQEDCGVALSQASAHPRCGAGGADQVYMNGVNPDTGLDRLRYVGTIRLSNFKGTGVRP
jgi:hypothetical protein